MAGPESSGAAHVLLGGAPARGVLDARLSTSGQYFCEFVSATEDGSVRATKSGWITAPLAARVAVHGLGRLDVQAPERTSPGGHSSLLASHARGAVPAIGFDADHPLVLLGEHTWLARGAVLRIHAGSRADLRAGTHVATEVLARATEVSVHLGAPRGCVVVTAIRSTTATAS